MSPERKRQVAAALLILGAVAAILLPFISSKLLTLALGGIAFSAGGESTVAEKAKTS